MDKRRLVYLFTSLILGLGLSACSVMIDYGSAVPQRDAEEGGRAGEPTGGSPVGLAEAGERAPPIGGGPSAGQTLGGGLIAGEPVAGEPVAGEPMAGEPVAGEPVAGEPVAGEPVGGGPVGGNMVEDSFMSLLPSPGCLVMSSGNNCLLTLNTREDELCDTYRAATDPTRIMPVVQHTACANNRLSSVDINQTKELLQLFRAPLNLDPVSISSPEDYQRCAIYTDSLYVNGEWDARAECFDSFSLDSLTLGSDLNQYVTHWSAFSLVAYMISATREADLPTRHRLLHPNLVRFNLGINRGGSCSSFDLANTTPVVPFSFYPGVGYQALESVTAGNHNGALPAWSVELLDRNISGLSVQLYELIGPDGQREMRPIRLLPQDSTRPELIAWHVTTPLTDGQSFEVELTWRDGQGLGRSMQLYNTFRDCGQRMPTYCDPTRVDECTVPYHNCAYFNYSDEDPNWFCRRSGPIERGGACGDYAGSCLAGDICLVDENQSRCFESCIVNSNSETSCAARCDNSVSLDRTVEGHEVGICP